MKKMFVHLSMLCLLAALLVPMVGCKKNEAEVEESPVTSESTTMEEPTTTTTTSDMTSDMGTDMMTSEPMGTDATTTP
jgi:hypothetical protein